jgi:TolB-like protein
MRKLLIPLAAVLLAACSTAQYNSSRWRMDKKETLAVLAFENYTESGMAGIKTAAMADGILSAAGIKTTDLYSGTDEKARSGEELKTLLSDLAARNIRYALTGSVNEWKYKAGLEGEPAVSLALAVRDTATGAVLWSSVASRTGNSCQSAGVLAQKTLDKVLRALK